MALPSQPVTQHKGKRDTLEEFRYIQIGNLSPGFVYEDWRRRCALRDAVGLVSAVKPTIVRTVNYICLHTLSHKYISNSRCFYCILSQKKDCIESELDRNSK